MFLKSNKRKARVLAALVWGTAANALAAPVFARVDQPPENQAAIKDLAKPLKTKLPAITDKRPPRYIKELEEAQSQKQLGNLPVKAVEVPLPGDLSPGMSLPRINPDGAQSNAPDVTDTGWQDQASVDIKRPTLKALISVQENLNPFTLDAQYIERVNLGDVLNEAIEENLSIESNYAGLKTQQYRYLSAASKFLPDIKSGYNLIGIKGSLPGALLGGGNGTVSLPSSFQILNVGFSQNLYQGGQVLFGTLEQRHRYRAARAQLKGNVNDVLLETSRRYYDLLLNEALLEIRTRAVEISEEQVRLNQAQERSGTATGLDVLQSQAQLASDQQNLVDQQSTRRQSSLQLASFINSSLSQDLVSAEDELKKKRLVPRLTPITHLLKTAIDNRPELKQYEELRIATRRAIVTAAAPLQPRSALAGTIYGIGAGGSDLTPLYNLSFTVNWNLGKLGTTDLANIQAAKWEARQAAIRAKQAFTDVFQQVRTAFDQSLAADKRIEHASAQIVAAEEELRIATKRMQAGIGLNIDVLNAQRDRTQACINKARALVDFNVAQAQLLHDVGLISVGGLTTGVKF